MSKRIGLFIRTLNKGGAERQSILLAKHLSKTYPCWLVVFYEEGHFIEDVKNTGIKLVFLNGSMLSKCLQLYNFLKRNRIDTLFNYSPINNIVGTLIGRFAGVKLIFGGIRGAALKKSKIKMFLNKCICNFLSTQFISNSFEAKKNYACYGLKEDKIIVIHNAIEFNRNQIIRKSSEPVRILSIGRFIEDKDYATALNSIKHIINNYPQYEEKVIYYIVGYGKLETDVKRTIEKLNINKSVKILDGRDDITSNYINSDIYLSTSTYEGMPNTIMEAMSYSLPIVSTNAGDINFLVADKVNGFLCNPKDYKSIAEKLMQLIDDYKLRKIMGKKSYELIKSNFSVFPYINKYRKLIEG